MNRRAFLHQSIVNLIGFGIPYLLPFGRSKASGVRIDQIELFRYDLNVPRHFSWGSWFNRQQVFMKMTAGDHVGWAEVAGSRNNPDLDLLQWGGFLQPFRHQKIETVYQALKLQQFGNGKKGKYNKRQIEFVEMALLDLLGKIEEKPTIDLLGMQGRKAVPGLFCILENDLQKVELAIRQAQAQDLDRFVKLKMYGDRAFDLSIIKLAREKLGEESFILSDANRGYKGWHSIEELAEILIQLNLNGLNAMEDPAELQNDQWIELQGMVNHLTLIPDYVTRPAWEGINRIMPGMGGIFNLHPESMGSLHHLLPLGNKIKSFGAEIMVGDASLVGPACNVWQQIAIGLGAKFVEALEKSEESKEYLDCVISKSTFRDENGNYSYKPAPGFGLEIDTCSLSDICYEHITL